jgi:hypothetical protein
MAIAFLELLPAFCEDGTVVVEADKQDIRTPSQAITDVKRRGLAAGEAFLAIGAVVFFVGQLNASFNVHGDILRRRMASGVGDGRVYRVTGAPAWGALALPAQEAGDVGLKLKTKKPTLRSSRNTIRGSWYFIKNFISQE